MDADKVEVYLLHILLQGISPAIWRRVLVRSDSSIGDLHYTIQIAMGWSDDHLNRFLLHGRWYGVPHIGGIGFAESSGKLLSEFELRLGERFLYEYDLRDAWRHQIRLERKLPLDPGQAYPVCVGGSRRVPPEDCGGPWRFMALRDRYTILDLVDCLEEFLACEDEEALGDCREELAHVLEWVDRERFDRRKVNQQLRRHASGEDVFALTLG